MKVNRFAEKFARFYHRMKFKGQAVNFNSLADDKNDCLVCLPANLQQVINASSRLPDIAAIFPSRLIKVLVTSNIDNRSHEYIKRFTLERPFSYDLTSFYMPKQTFIERIVGRGISICIDLDFEHNFFNSSVCLLSRAPLRIGSLKGLGMPYYNMEIDIGEKSPINPGTYERFIKVLYNFRYKGEEIAPIET